MTYQLTPLDTEHANDGCRQFRLIAHGSFGLSEGRTVACTDGHGVWLCESLTGFSPLYPRQIKPEAL